MLRTEMITITAGDTAAAEEVVELASEYLTTLGEARAERGDNVLLGDIRNNRLVRRPYCFEASDCVTRAAQVLGIVAAREFHNGHYLTSFSDPTASATEQDPTLCMTWGQFADKPLEADAYYFGERKSIQPLVPRYYEANFSADSVFERQTTFTPGMSEAAYATWLRHVPLLPSGNLVLGQVDRDDYPDKAWTIPYTTRPPIW